MPNGLTTPESKIRMPEDATKRPQVYPIVQKNNLPKKPVYTLYDRRRYYKNLKAPKTDENGRYLTRAEQKAYMRDHYGMTQTTVTYPNPNYTPAQREEAKWFSNADDPFQINSILDVLSYTFDPVDNGGNMYKAFKYAGKEWLNRKFIKPWEYKSWKMFALNNLVGFGETMDIAANLAKAILPTDWTTGKNYTNDKRITKDVLSRLKSATGIGVKGRYSYDMDVHIEGKNRKADAAQGIANKAINFLGEVVVDPINWFTFGTNILAKSGEASMKVATKESAENISKWYAKSIAKNADKLGTISKAFRFTPEDIIKQMDAVDKANYGILKNIISNESASQPKLIYSLFQSDPEFAKLLKQRDLVKLYIQDNMDEFDRAFNKYVQGLVQSSDESAYTKLLKQTLQLEDGQAIIQKLGRNVMDFAAEGATHKVNFNVIRGLYRAADVANKVDDTVTFIAGAPFIPAFRGIKKYIKSTHLVDYIHNAMLRKSIQKNQILPGSGIVLKHAEEVYEDITKAIDNIPDDVLHWSIKKAAIEKDTPDYFAQSVSQDLYVIINSITQDDATVEKVYGTLKDFLKKHELEDIADLKESIDNLLKNHPNFKKRFDEVCPHYKEWLDIFDKINTRTENAEKYKEIIRNITEHYDEKYLTEGVRVDPVTGRTFKTAREGITLSLHNLLHPGEAIDLKRMPDLDTLLRELYEIDPLEFIDFATDYTKLKNIRQHMANVIKYTIDQTNALRPYVKGITGENLTGTIRKSYERLMAMYQLVLDYGANLEYLRDLDLETRKIINPDLFGYPQEFVNLAVNPKTLKVTSYIDSTGDTIDSNIKEYVETHTLYEIVTHALYSENDTYMPALEYYLGMAEPEQYGKLFYAMYEEFVALAEQATEEYKYAVTVVKNANKVNDLAETVKQLHSQDALTRKQCYSKVGALQDSPLGHTVRYKEEVQLNIGDVRKLFDENLFNGDTDNTFKDGLIELMYQVSETEGLDNIYDIQANFPMLYRVLFDEDDSLPVDLKALSEELDSLARGDMTHIFIENNFIDYTFDHTSNFLESGDDIADIQFGYKDTQSGLLKIFENNQLLDEQSKRDVLAALGKDPNASHALVKIFENAPNINDIAESYITQKPYVRAKYVGVRFDPMYSTSETPYRMIVNTLYNRGTTLMHITPDNKNLEYVIPEFTKRFDDVRRVVTQEAERRAAIFAENAADVSIKVNSYAFKNELISGDVGQMLLSSLDPNGNTAKGIGRVIDRIKNTYRLNDVPLEVMSDTQRTLYHSLNAIENMANRIKLEQAWDMHVARSFTNVEIAMAFREVFESYREAAYPFIQTSNYIIKMSSDINLNLMAHHSGRSLSLDNLVRGGGNTISKGYEDTIKMLCGEDQADEIIERIAKYGHDDPGSDTLASIMAYAHECPEEFEALRKRLAANNSNAIAFDIECGYAEDLATGTTNKMLGQISQIGLTRINADGVQECLVYRIKGAGLADLPATAKVIYVADEIELLNSFEDYLSLYSNNLEKVLGYNSEAFDVPWILHRWAEVHKGNIISDVTSEFSEAVNRAFKHAQMSTFETYARAGLSSNEHHIDILNSLKRKEQIPILTFKDIESIADCLSFWDKNPIRRRNTAGININDVNVAIKEAVDGINEFNASKLINAPSDASDEMLDLAEGAMSKATFINNDDLTTSDIRALHEYVSDLQMSYENFRSEMTRMSIAIDPANGEVIGEYRLKDIFNMYPTFTPEQDAYYMTFWPEATSTLQAWRMHELYNAFTQSRYYRNQLLDPQSKFFKPIFKKYFAGEQGYNTYCRVAELYAECVKAVYKQQNSFDLARRAFRTQLAESGLVQGLKYAEVTTLADLFTPSRVIDELLGGRKELTNLSQVWTKRGETSFFNYKIVNRPGVLTEPFNKPGYLSYFNIPEGTKFATSGNAYQKDTLNIINDVYRDTQKDLDRLRSLEGLFDRVLESGEESLGIFRDPDELLSIIKRVQEAHTFDNIEYEPSWIVYLDLDSLKTPAERFTIFYEMLNDKYYSAELQEILFEQLQNMGVLLDKYDKDAIISGLIDDMNRIAFGAGKGNSFFGVTSQSNPYSIFHSAGWELMNSTERLTAISMYYHMSDIDASAKTIARRRLSDVCYKFANRFTNKNLHGQKVYAAAVNNELTKLINKNKLSILERIADPSSGYALRYLLFESNLIRLNSIRKAVGDADEIAQYESLMTIILKNEDAFKKQGIEFYRDDGAIWMHLSRNNKPPVIDVDPESGIRRGIWQGKTYTGFTADERTLHLFEIPEGATGLINGIPVEDLADYNELIRTAAKHNTNFIGTSRICTKRYSVDLYNTLPKSLRENMFSPDELDTAGFFTASALYDNHNLSLDCYNLQGYHSNYSTLKDLIDGVKYSINTEDEMDLMIDTLFDRNSGMDLLNAEGHLCAGLTDEECIAIANSNDLVPLIWVPNKSELGGYVDVFKVYDQKSLAQARELNAVLVPYQLYSKMFETINMSAKSTTGLLHSRFIRGLQYAYKVGYLTNMGTWFRNILDSNIKAMIDTRDPMGMLQNTHKANQLLLDYDKTINLMSSAKGLSTNLSDTQVWKFYHYDSYKALRDQAMPMEDFFFVRGFIDNGPSAGESQALTNWIKKAREAQGVETDLYTKYINAGSHILKPMSFIESRVRLAQYLTLIDQGVLKTDAFVRVSHSAFDYNVKSRATQLMEMIIPFYNFQKLNLLYWIEEFEKNPALLRAVDDYWGVAQNSYSVDSATVGDSDMGISLYNNIMAGNLMLNAGPKLDPYESQAGFIVKLNPSYIDAINLLMSPGELLFDPSDPYAKLKTMLWQPLTKLPELGKNITGMLMSGMDCPQGTEKNYIENVGNVTMFWAMRNAPILSTILDRIFRPDQMGSLKINPKDSAGTKNFKRLYNSGETAQAYVAATFPGMFGAVSRWVKYTEDSVYTFTNYKPYWDENPEERKKKLKYPDSYKDRYAGRTNRTYNYYKPSYNRYTNSDALRQIMYKMHKIHKMRYNISRLSTNLVSR